MAKNLRETLSCAPEAVFRCLPRMGRVMLTSRVPGVTHERMGAVESVVVEQGKVRCGGASHDAVIDPSAIRSIIVDRTGRMKDQALPRIDFMGEGDAIVIGVVGLDGLEVFDAALAGVGEGSALAEAERPPFQQSALAENDPGQDPLAAACKAGLPITIEMRRPGSVQAWRGVVAEVKPAMGFINVMRPDFHLHLRGGSVRNWRREVSGPEVALWAEDDAGQRNGLVLRGTVGAFG